MHCLYATDALGQLNPRDPGENKPLRRVWFAGLSDMSDDNRDEWAQYVVLATKTVIENVSPITTLPRLVSVQVSLATPLLMSVETGLAYLFGEGAGLLDFLFS